jgi:hypothetical protein
MSRVRKSGPKAVEKSISSAREVNLEKVGGMLRDGEDALLPTRVVEDLVLSGVIYPLPPEDETTKEEGRSR